MPEMPEEPTSLQRVLMDRARAHAERDQERPPRRLFPLIAGAALALGLVLVIALGFDAFLESMQRVMEIGSEEEVPAEPSPEAPMPAYVVPKDPASTAELADPSATTDPKQ
jgi:hypothetical protein